MAVLTHKDAIVQTVTAGGPAGVTLGAAATSVIAYAQALGSGDDGKVFPYIFYDGAAVETGRGTYTHSGSPSGQSFARTTRDYSSTGSALDLTTSAIFMVGWTANLGTAFTDFRSVFGQDEVSVTTTATLTINRMHVCSGTTADYTVTLPAASGNTGKLLGVRMANALTKQILLDGNASETIDGALNKPMLAGDSVILLCDGSNWATVGERFERYMDGYVDVVGDGATTTTLTSVTFTKVSGAFATVNANGRSWWDTTNKKFLPLVAGRYLCNAAIGIDQVGTQKEFILEYYKNGSGHRRVARVHSVLAGGGIIVNGAAIIDFNGSTDYIEVFVYNGDTVDRLTEANAVTVIFQAVYVGP